MIIIVLVHVDDCTIAATAIMLIERFKNEIAKHVEITDLGEHPPLPTFVYQLHSPSL